MSEGDEALKLAWRSADEDHTDEVEQELERLLPALVDAAYAETRQAGRGASHLKWSPAPTN